MTVARRKYLAAFEVRSNNLSGFLPDVPGVVSTASSLEEMRQTMREAVEFHTQALAADGDSIPEPHTTTVDFAHVDQEHGVLSCIVEWLGIEVPRMQRVA